MAGVFDDAPSNRMAWDTDGTVVLSVVGNGERRRMPGANTPPPIAWASTSLSQRQQANNENAGDIAWFSTGNWVWGVRLLLFPELREVDGWYQNVRNSKTVWESYSQDTTNGHDGTFSSASVTAYNTGTTNHYRDNIDSMALNNITALMEADGDDSSNEQTGIRNMHIYGQISPAQTPDRILFLDTENADAPFTKVLDFGDVPQGQTQTRTFKIKNNSSTLTINSIQVEATDLYLNAGDWYTFGDNGATYVSTFAVGNLANGAEKLLYMKQVIPGGETLGPQAARIDVTHASVT